MFANRMTVTTRHFRILLTLSWVTILVGVVVDIATEPLLPEPLREYVQIEDTDEWEQKDWSIFTICIPFLVMVIASYVGLYKFKRWGRYLWLWTGVAGFALTPALGPAVATAWAESFYFVATALYGVILALAYVPPAAHWIEGKPGVLPNADPMTPAGRRR
jgi:MFS family permease